MSNAEYAFWYKLGQRLFSKNTMIARAYREAAISSYPKSEDAYRVFAAGWNSVSEKPRL